MTEREFNDAKAEFNNAKQKFDAAIIKFHKAERKYLVENKDIKPGAVLYDCDCGEMSSTEIYSVVKDILYPTDSGKLLVDTTRYEFTTYHGNSDIDIRVSNKQIALSSKSAASSSNESELLECIEAALSKQLHKDIICTINDAKS